MKIVLDNIIFSIQHSGGISVVWYELLSRLMVDPCFSLSFIDNSCAENKWRKMLSIDQRQVISTINNVSVTRTFPVRVKNNQKFIFHSSYYRYCLNSNAVNITTVHDFTNEVYAKGIKKKIHTWQKYRAIRHSDRIVCISENTKNDLIARIPDVDESTIKVIYNGVSDDYFVLNKRLDYQLPFPSHSYLLFVGSRASYKNFNLVVSSVKETGYNLIIVGPKLSNKERLFIESQLPTERFCDMGFVENEILNILYNHALCLAYPSSYEGFGIPVIEAQRAGCPVIAYNVTSIPEVCGSSPLLIEKPTVDEMVKKLYLLDNKSLVEEVRNKGIENAQRFTWDSTYRGYKELYEEIEQSFEM